MKMMNLNKWVLVAVLTITAISFTSCESHDDGTATPASSAAIPFTRDGSIDNRTPASASDLEGTYTGQVAIVGTPTYVGVATIKVTSTGVNSVKLQFTSPAELTKRASITSDLLVEGDNEVRSATSPIANITYHKKEKNIIYQSTQTTNILCFQGKKN